MDDQMQAQFQRVENALITLVDSIAAYNPSPQAAVDLIAADDELSQGLDQLAQHQANHTRIQALRAEAEALEAQLKSSVATLASLRRELYETPATTFPEDSRPVPFDELLQYAKNISKYTVPPTYRERLPASPKADQPKERENGGSSGAASQGVGTPANAAATQGAFEDNPEAPKDTSADEAEWMKKLTESQVLWSPWPGTDKIRQGNLMQIQNMLDTGKDPTKTEAAKQADEGEKSTAVVAQDPTVGLRDVGAQALPKPVATAKPAEPAGTFMGFGFTESDEE